MQPKWSRKRIQKGRTIESSYLDLSDFKTFLCKPCFTETQIRLPVWLKADSFFSDGWAENRFQVLLWGGGTCFFLAFFAYTLSIADFQPLPEGGEGGWIDPHPAVILVTT